MLFLRNDGKLGVLNGTRGVVGAAGGDGLVVSTGRGPVEVPYSYLENGHLGHSCASTIHKAQGATVGRAFVLGGEAMYREAGYVSMSRAAAGTDPYVPTSAFESSWGSGGGDPGPLGSIRAALRQSRAKHLALESVASGQKPDDIGGAPRFRREPEAGETWRRSDAVGPDRRSASPPPQRTDVDQERPVEPLGSEIAGGGDLSFQGEPPGLRRRAFRWADRLRRELPGADRNRQALTASPGAMEPELDRASSPRRGSQADEQSDTAAILALLGAYEPVLEPDQGRELGRGG